MARYCEIISTSRDMVGNNIVVKSNIIETRATYDEVVTTIIVPISNGASLENEEIVANVLAIYELGLEG